MVIALGAVLPHAPILIEPIGGTDTESARGTLSAYRNVARDITASQVDALVIVGPHGPEFSDAFTLLPGSLQGSFASFGHPEISLSFTHEQVLAKALLDTARSKGIALVELDLRFRREFGVPHGLDHGVLVPLFLLHSLGLNLPVLVVNPSRLSRAEHYYLGMAIAEAASAVNKRVAVIASGDLSHCVTTDAPYPYNPAGQEYDAALLLKLLQGQALDIVTMDERQIDKALSCGHRPITVMLGALDGAKLSSAALHYEAPFGVGYAVSLLKPLELQQSLWPSILEEVARQRELRRKSEPPLVVLARRAVEAYVREQKLIEPPLTEELREPSACFVSLKLNGELRGCIGATSPSYGTLGEEVVHMAIAACSEDSRFDPVEEWELDDLEYSVDILYPAEVVSDLSELDPTTYGLIVEEGSRKGLLLPNLEGVDTVSEQLRIACQKAGIELSERTKISRFRVARHAL